MKKLNLLVLPLMAISFLASCGGGSNPSEDVKFSIQESSVTLKEDNTIKVHLDWTPTNHSIEFSNFTFTLDSGSTTATVAPGTVGDRPLELTITFASALTTNDKGDLKFHYNDKTTKEEGEGKVNDINIKIEGEKPSFSVTDSTVDYDEGTHSAMVELNWEPASDSITFSNLDFAYGTKHADEVIAEAATSSPVNIQIKFGDTGLDEDVTGTLNFTYSDTTTGVTGKDKIENITIDVDESKQVVFMLSSEQQTTMVDKSATVYVDWKPIDHTIEFESFTFITHPVKKNIVTFELVGTPRPMPATITFGTSIIEDISGTLSFTYKDLTAKTTGNSSVDITINPILPSSITLSDDEETLINGVTTPYTLTATVLPETATDKSVTWTSSDPSVVEVVDGKCTAKSIGEATITAKTCNGLTDTCNIKVSEPVIVNMNSGDIVEYLYTYPKFGTTTMELNSVTYNTYVVEHQINVVGIKFTEIKWTCKMTAYTELTNALWVDIKNKNNETYLERVKFAEEEPATTEMNKQYTCTDIEWNDLPLSGAPYTISLHYDSPFI